MSYNNQLLKSLEKINLQLDESYSQMKDVGVLSGMSGVVLFKFYYCQSSIKIHTN